MKHNIILAFSFAKRDFKEKYVGTGLGQLWYIISPLVMIFIYTVIFSDFMKMKMNIVDNSYAYSIYLVPGLLAWTTFSTVIMRLNTSILEKAGLIKKINVPMYTFNLSILLNESFTFIISIFLALIFLLLVHQPITWVFLWLIPVILLQSIFSLGVGVILSLFTPFIKDMKEIVPIVMQLWFWMTPIIYLKEMLEDRLPLLLVLNPFYYFVEIYQNIFVYAKAPSVHSIFIIVIESFISLIVAGYLYKKMMPTIKDII